MLIVGIGLMLISLAVAFFGVCFVKGLKHIVIDTITINVNGMSTVSVPSVFGDGLGRPGGVISSSVPEDAPPVVVPMDKFDDSNVESNLKVKETKAKSGLNEAAAALKKTIKDKDKETV